MQAVNESFLAPFCLARLAAHLARAALALVTLVLLASGGLAWSQDVAVNTLQAQVQQLARQASGNMPAGTRVEVEVGTLDPRLKLAPCARITPHLPAGMRLWGRAQVGLRCDEGARWSVFVPITVKVFAKAWSATQPLPVGTLVSAAHLQLDEVDLAAEPSPVIASAQAAVGRTTARALRPGQALREADLRPRQWFAAGDTVRVFTVGSGYSISAEGQALSAGLEGQPIKVRTEGGRVVSGRATGARQVEVAM
jgi:flagella basal body P-ring formation protein FlgA